MAFSGKRFRRTRCENIDELMKENNASDHTIQLLKSSAPIFSFTRVDEQTFTFVLQTEHRTMTDTFRLGEEHEMERRDGSKSYANDPQTFTFVLETEHRTMTDTFRLVKEHEMERRDGSKVKVTYTLESDNVLTQVIRPPIGKVAYFRREFGDSDIKMTVRLEGVDKEAKIYYEMVD